MLDNPMLQERNERNFERGSPLAGYRSWSFDNDDEPEDMFEELDEEVVITELKEAV